MAKLLDVLFPPRRTLPTTEQQEVLDLTERVGAKIERIARMRALDYHADVIARREPDDQES